MSGLIATHPVAHPPHNVLIPPENLQRRSRHTHIDPLLGRDPSPLDPIGRLWMLRILVPLGGLTRGEHQNFDMKRGICLIQPLLFQSLHAKEHHAYSKA